MIAYLNGRFMPEGEAMVSVADRGFLYGDGLFETIRVHRGALIEWAGHCERLAAGAVRLQLKLVPGEAELRTGARGLVSQNAMTEGVVRLAISRGISARGYAPRADGPPTVVMTLHSAPVLDPAVTPQWRLITAGQRVWSGDFLAAHKTANKLGCVLARGEAEVAGADEALLLNERGEVVEATGANVFWVEPGGIRTPPLAAGALAGVTRRRVCQLAARRNLPAAERPGTMETLRQATGVFLTQSTLGVIEVVGLDGEPLRRSPLTRQLRTELLELWAQEARIA